MDYLMFNMEYFLKNSNTVKQMVIDRLLKDGAINETQAIEYTEKWNIIVIKPSWFEKWKNKFRADKNDDEYLFKFVKFED